MTHLPRLSGAQLAVARLIWLAAAFAALALALGTIPDFVREASTIAAPSERTFSQLTLAEAQVLAEWGVPVSAYAAFVLAWIMSPMLAFILMASVIFLRRADDRAAWLISLLLVALGGAVPYFSGITVFRPGWQTAVDVARGLGVFALLMLTYLFPDGRFVPRWTRLIAIVWPAWIVYWVLIPGTPYGFMDQGGALTPAGLIFLVLGLGLSVLAQRYRYRSISTPLERQQGKVFAFGFAATLGLYLAAVLPYFASAAVRAPGLPYVVYGLWLVPLVTRLALVLIPVNIGFAILRYRLWDIDLIIRRTLVYAVLTGALALVYASAVVILQPLFAAVTGQRQTELSTVLSTLAMAALFGPLRARVQTSIDRRFYRRRYDVAKTLAAFGHTIHTEVDVSRVAERLVGIVEETVQPGHVSLWLLEQPAPAASQDPRRPRNL
jgi:hypothetical protein